MEYSLGIIFLIACALMHIGNAYKVELVKVVTDKEKIFNAVKNGDNYEITLTKDFSQATYGARIVNKDDKQVISLWGTFCQDPCTYRRYAATVNEMIHKIIGVDVGCHVPAGTYTTVPEFEVEEKFKDPNGLTWPVLSVEFIFKDPDDERVNVGRIYAKYYTDET